MVRTDVRLFNSGSIYGITCRKDSIITRNTKGSAVFYEYPYNRYSSGLSLPDGIKFLYYDNGRPLYKNESKLFYKNKQIATPR